MSLHLSGTIQKQALGLGVWTLVADDGKTYELKQAPTELKQVGLRVKVEGQVLTDAVSLAMVGPILSVQKFEPIP